MFLLDLFNYVRKWPKEEKRLDSLLKELEAIREPTCLNDEYRFAVEYLTKLSFFQDEGELQETPFTKVECMADFKFFLRKMGRNPHGFNRSKVGEVVTLDSLWLGDFLGLARKPARFWFYNQNIYDGFCKRHPGMFGFTEDPTMSRLILKAQVEPINNSKEEVILLCRKLLS